MDGIGSPRGYGAVADGIADDTDAVNACLANHRAVDLGGPESVYLITSPILVAHASGQVLTASGATLRAGAATDLLWLRNAGHTVSGLVLDGGPHSVRGIVVAGSAGSSRIEGCVVTDVAGHAVSVEAGAHRTRVSGCVIRRSGAVSVAGADFCDVSGNDLTECRAGIAFHLTRFARCRGNTLVAAGIEVSSGYGVAVEGNSVADAPGAAVHGRGCRNLTIRGNATSGGAHGVLITGTTASVTVTGNTSGGAAWGVGVEAGTSGVLVIGVTVTGNTISHPTAGGIRAAAVAGAQVSGVTVADNDIHAAGRYGVSMAGVDSCRVNGNRVHRPTGECVLLTGVDVVHVHENLLQDAGRDAVAIESSNRVLVRDNTAYGGARHAVRLAGGGGMTVSGTRWRSIGSTGIADGATGTVLFDNMEPRPVRIMPLGDSITDGDDYPGGYRVGLWRRLAQAGYRVDLVGTRSNGPPELGDRDHEGHSGWRIGDLDASVVSYLRSHMPDVVLLHIGTNDINGNHEVDTAGARLSQLVDKIFATAAGVDVFLATIIPHRDPPRDGQFRAYNGDVRAVVSAQRGRGRSVHLVEMHDKVVPATDYYDSLHPNEQGCEKMAKAWCDALLSVPSSLVVSP